MDHIVVDVEIQKTVEETPGRYGYVVTHKGILPIKPWKPGG